MRKYESAVPRPAWFAFLREGDVLRAPSGVLRVVRNVTRSGDYWDWRRDGKTGRRHGPSCGEGALSCVTFVKLRHSRYQCATTVYFATELKHWQYVGARLKLDKPQDVRVRDSIDERDGLDAARIIHQREAVGTLP